MATLDKELTTTITNALTGATIYISRVNTKLDTNVMEAYYSLIHNLALWRAIPPVTPGQLLTHQIEGDDIISALKNELPNFVSRPGQEESSKIILELAQRLSKAVAEATWWDPDNVLRLIRTGYKQYLREQQLWSSFAITASFLGFLLIGAGIFLSYITNATIGIMTLIAGVAVNLTCTLSFRQATKTAAHANAIYERYTDLENNSQLSAQIRPYYIKPNLPPTATTHQESIPDGAVGDWRSPYVDKPNNVTTSSTQQIG